MTCLVMMGILLFGVVGYRSLPVSDLPNIDFPTLQVQAQLPGASPETMAASVATILERQFSTVPGLDNMSSSSVRGNVGITMQFMLDRNIDAAAQDTQSAIAAVTRRLPPNMPAPPSVSKVNPADQPILFMGLNSKTISAAHCGRIRGNVDRSGDFEHQRRLTGQRFRDGEVRGTRAVGSQPTGRARHRHRRGGDLHREPQRQSAVGNFVGTAPGFYRGSQRPGNERGRLPAFGGGLPQRIAGAAGRPGQSNRRRAERQNHHLARTTRRPSCSR